MTIIQFTLYASVIIYSLLYDLRLLMIMAAIITAYVILGNMLYPGNSGSGRKKLAMALWAPPSEGLIHSKLEIDVSKVQAFLQTKEAKDAHITMTHVCIKAVAQCLNAGRKTINGKIVFGKFVPAISVDVSCAINVGEGSDLAVILIENADKKSFEEIAQYINVRGQLVRKGEDEEHQARSNPLKFLAPFIISIVIQLTSFLTYNLGLTIKPLHFKKNCFGTATVTSLGGFKFKDVFVPFTPVMRNSFIISVNQVLQKPVVKDGQIVIAPILIINFTIDHRFMDGAQILQSNQAFWDVFENPEKYVTKQ